MNPGAFLDRDGTINVDAGYVARPEELEFQPGAIEAIRLLNETGHRIAVITNQAGVARGYHSESDVQAFHAEMTRQLAEQGVRVDRYYYCPHHVEGTVAPYNVECDCRKPGDTLYRRAIEDLGIDPARSLAVGDKATDLTPALALGATAFLVDSPDHEEDQPTIEAPFERVDSLLTAVSNYLRTTSRASFST